MAYQLHISRRSDPRISIHEWEAAVLGMDDVRLGEDFSEARAPGGEIIRVELEAPVAEVRHADDRWLPVFVFSPRTGRASCKASFDPGAADDPDWQAAVALCRKLDAQLTGDEGEVYDLDTGQIDHRN